MKKIKEVGAELVDYDDQVKKADPQLDIGFTTKALLAKLTDEGHDPQKFYDGVRSFYEKACSYARSALPLSDPLLKNARFLNFARRESADVSEVEYFVGRFSSLLPFSSDPTKMNQLGDEYVSYQLLEKGDVPADVWENATIYPEESSSLKPSIYSMDLIWAHLATKTNVDGSSQFPLLSQVAQLALTIPHSNASEERVFSLVRKNKTPFRPNLDPEETLGSIVTTKMALSDVPEPPKISLWQLKGQLGSTIKPTVVNLKSIFFSLSIVTYL